MLSLLFFFFNDTATTEIYTLSLHDALPISWSMPSAGSCATGPSRRRRPASPGTGSWRSEEHTSELQSRRDLVCRLLLEKKKKTTIITKITNAYSFSLSENFKLIYII